MKYMVCWLSYLRGECLESYSFQNETLAPKIYIIEAKSKKNAVELFLHKKALERMKLLDNNLKDDCIANMVKGIYRYKTLTCLECGVIQRNFAYETKLVVKGNYYNPDTRQNLSKEEADILGIIKEIDTAPISEIIDTKFYVDVFMETYRHEAAVIELMSLRTKLYCWHPCEEAMSDYYMVCWKNNIENLINDDAIFYDSPDRLSGSDVINYIITASPEDAIKQYLLSEFDNAYLKKVNWLRIKRRCATRIVRRIVSGEAQLLPQQVFDSGCFYSIVTIVNSCIDKAPIQLMKNSSIEFFDYLADNIDIDEVAAWIDIHSAFELFVEIYSKDVTIHKLINWEDDTI